MKQNSKNKGKVQKVIAMAEKSGFWGARVVPWSPKNICKWPLYVLVLTALPFVVIWLLTRRELGGAAIPAGCLLAPVVISTFLLAVLLIIAWLLKKAAAKLPEGALLRSSCIVVPGMLEAPGVAQISSGRLIICPLAGRQISIPLHQISNITEHRLYNGRPYLGTTIFFKLTVPRTISGKWRLRFGVEHAEQWRKLLADR